MSKRGKLSPRVGASKRSKQCADCEKNQLLTEQLAEERAQLDTREVAISIRATIT